MKPIITEEYKLNLKPPPSPLSEEPADLLGSYIAKAAYLLA